MYIYKQKVLVECNAQPCMNAFIGIDINISFI